MLPELPTLYWYLALARIILVLIPQLGYIHPDEFFQSIEVEAGRAFEVESNIPWEFNTSFPIRSMCMDFVKQLTILLGVNISCYQQCGA
ncbi:hypothetical protein MTP99_019415 [Tenebrio molitor]|nr:hypothetical protein MTP99_019415 [Tenebrio molitor]